MTHINIPDKLYQKLQERIKSSKEFSSVEEYVNFVLNEVLQQTSSQQTPEQPYSKKQEEEVKQRLHDLGYLD